MTDSDQSTAAAPRPHRLSGDTDASRKPSLWARVKALMNFRAPTLREDLAEALGEDTNGYQAEFSDNERTILQNVLKLAETRVEDVMVPRPDIEAIDGSETIAALIAHFHQAGHSRLPVFEDNLDQIRGFVHIKDALKCLTEVKKLHRESGETNGNGLPVKLLTPVLKQKIAGKNMVRKLLFVPPAMPVGTLLQQMQAQRVHIAVVVDEYGGTDGLVTIEDLLEAVVGDIEDEHDDADAELIRKTDETGFIADARAELVDLQQMIGPDFEPGRHGEEVDTLGGLIFEMIDRVPVRGEVITKLKGFELEILQADARRIKKVKITRRKRPVRARSAKSVPVPADTAETGGKTG